MSQEKRVIDMEQAVPAGAEAMPLPTQTVVQSESAMEEYPLDIEGAPERRLWLATIGIALTGLAALGWTALFAYANQQGLMSGGTLEQWIGWVRDWSLPMLLLAVVWLLAMRNSRSEARRFGDVARVLSGESVQLEHRLTIVNRELSLAREFLAAQSRDLESLGRLASERLSQHASHLAELVQDNGTRIDTIASVSEAALDNMEKLRSQLPVIVSSAKDVTNNIGTAGRTANTQIEAMVGGFNKLNQFGQASERQVHSLKSLVDETIAEFTHQSEQLGGIAQSRFASLTEQGEKFRTRLDSHEIAALAAIRNRASSLGEELEATRALLDSHEAESLTSLRARLGSVRDESTAIARSLRDGEASALDAWRNSIRQLEDDLRAAIDKVGEIDGKAMESARSRLASLTEEARQVDDRMAERDRMFATELERRQTEMDARHAQLTESLSARLAMIDAETDKRRETQMEHTAQLVEHAGTLSGQLGEFTDRIAEITAQGGKAEATLAASLTALASNLEQAREKLSGTDGRIIELTDHSVRLLELIQASVRHSAEELPAAMAIGEERLDVFENRAVALRETMGEAEARGAELSEHMRRIGALHTGIDEKIASQFTAMEQMRTSLESIGHTSGELAEHAQSELRKAIDALSSSAREAVSGIEEMSAASIGALAARLGEESSAAIDQAMRERSAEVAGRLEEATARAAGTSRETVIQLRDQLAKVNELTGNLERRIAQAKSRAEEQVDNDFARRVALITESLNSNAIDIARALDTDVSDTAWSAYLKGDRGIFTRRAVKLLDAGEAKSVTQLYDSERDFREHVSHFIHDFEAMLRQLLSTRDGHALGVTLLSSDMGKLYVALAQAIERLRN